MTPRARSVWRSLRSALARRKTRQFIKPGETALRISVKRRDRRQIRYKRNTDLLNYATPDQQHSPD